MGAHTNDAEADGPERGRTTLHLVDGDEWGPVAEPVTRPNLLVASLDESTLETAMRHRRTRRTAPERFHVIAQPEPTRSASAAADASAGASLPFSAETIDDADDLATLAKHLSSTLSTWTGPDTLVVLDGVEAAIETAGEARVFRLLHVLTRLVTSHGAALSVVLDAAAPGVDAAVFRPLFDEVDDRRGE